MELYKCPIEVFKCTPVIDAFDDLSRKIAETFDNEVINEVHKVGIKVNKDELLKALAYDRGQYEKGYADAKSEYEPKRGEWIPCSERLPEEEGEYFVTVKKTAFDTEYDATEVAYCSPNHKWFNVSNCKVIAWMPLPKPYCGVDMRKEK